jgi:hypothetical protein
MIVVRSKRLLAAGIDMKYRITLRNQFKAIEALLYSTAIFVVAVFIFINFMVMMMGYL